MSHLSASRRFSCRYLRCSAHYYNVRFTAGTMVVYHVFLCIVRHFSYTAFLCDTISMEEELLYSPRLPDSPTWIAADTPVRKVCSSGEKCGLFSDSSIIDMIYMRRYGSPIPLGRSKVMRSAYLGSQVSSTTLSLKVAI